MLKILAVVGARPQFIKHFPVEKVLSEKFEVITLHTGQHYNENMSQVFFDQFGLSKPAYQFNVLGKTHAEQTAEMMVNIERAIKETNPRWVLVYGDTNSTIAGALAASKLHVEVVHVEAGLRSWNRQMPEEVNRVLTDHISKILFTTSSVSVRNLENEGITENVYEIGDVMKDSLELVLEGIGMEQRKEGHIYVTLHRPYNTDVKKRLQLILNQLNSLDSKVIFPIHPRTVSMMSQFGFSSRDFQNIKFIEPVGYIENIQYLRGAQCLITDSGGMQKEAYWLKKKCITIRSETEWIETTHNHWNTLLFEDLSLLKHEISKPPGQYMELYGKNASEKIAEILLSHA